MIIGFNLTKSHISNKRADFATTTARLHLCNRRDQDSDHRNNLSIFGGKTIFSGKTRHVNLMILIMAALASASYTRTSTHL